jgi:predicted esterase YcpF (UPF0227 family)
MIIHLHGFNSSPASHKANLTKAWLEERSLGHLFSCPALPHRPQEAVRAIEAAMQGRDPRRVTFIGSSLGGFYATHFVEQTGARAVLVNPAVTPYEGLASALGTQTNLYTGEVYELTGAHLDGWRALAVDRVSPERYLLLVETGDEVLDYRRAVARYQGADQIVIPGGDHSLQTFAQHVPRILAFAGY